MFFRPEHLWPWRSLRSWRPYFLIFFLAFLIYGQTLFFDFTYFDDQDLIIDKAALLSDTGNIGRIFTSDAFFSVNKFYYRPLLNLSFMLDAQAAGILAPAFHLDNILIHVLAVALVFYLLARLTGKRPLAFWLSLIFLVHPVLAQAVAWLPGRNDSLLTFFVLAAFISFLNFLERPRLRSFLPYLLFLLAALLTKESAVGLPLLAIFYLFFVDRGALERSDRWLLVIGSAAAGFVWFLMRYFALGGDATDYPNALLGLARNLPALLVQLGKLVLPVNLSVLPILADSSLVYGAVVLLALLAVLWFSREKSRTKVIFGALWFLIFLLPSFIRLNTLPDFLEHRLYLSFFGFLLIIAEIDWIKSLDFSQRRVKIMVAAVILILSLVTVLHSRNFSDRLTFWRSAAASSPHSPLAQRNLGVMYYFAGDRAAATTYYAKALELNPNEPMVHNNLGVIYMDDNNLALAEQEFRAELAVNPDYDKALFNLGEVSERRGRFAEAIGWFAATLRANPAYEEAAQRLLILQEKLR